MTALAIGVTILRPVPSICLMLLHDRKEMPAIAERASHRQFELAALPYCARALHCNSSLFVLSSSTSTSPCTPVE